MARKCPEILDMDPADVTERLMLLKVLCCTPLLHVLQVIPECDSEQL